MSVTDPIRKLNLEDTAVLEGCIRQMSDSVKKIGGGRSNWRYCCNYELVLCEGIKMTKAFPPSAVIHLLAQRCYANSSHMTDVFLKNGFSAVYCEGMALADVIGGFPIEHAWVMLEGKVYDPTWTGKDGTPTGLAYIGIPFDQKYVRRTIKQTKSASMLDNFTFRFPLLEHEPPKHRHAKYPLKETADAT